MSYSAKKFPQADFFPAKKDVMLPPGTFNGKVVLVTGGGTGLGKAMVTKFSQLGASVAIAARRVRRTEYKGQKLCSHFFNTTRVPFSGA